MVQAFRWYLWFGLKASSSRVLFTTPNAMREGADIPSLMPLFRTDDRSSQHNGKEIFLCLEGLVFERMIQVANTEIIE